MNTRGLSLLVAATFVAFSVSAEETRLNIHQQIVDKGTDMSLVEIEEVYQRRYIELAGSDGQFSLDEFKNSSEVKRQWQQALDNPAMKKLSPDQLAAAKKMMEEGQTSGFNLVDTDKNGFLSDKEFVGFSTAWISRVDTNHDQILSVAEIKHDLDQRKALAEEALKSIPKLP